MYVEGLFLNDDDDALHSRDMLDLVDVQLPDNLNLRQLLAILAFHERRHDFLRSFLHGNVEVRSA